MNNEQSITLKNITASIWAKLTPKLRWRLLLSAIWPANEIVIQLNNPTIQVVGKEETK